MTIHQASRTLLKSPPELWAECSEASSLNRHLDRFGAIRITRLEPETIVAWEGDNVSGTVELEPSGWGTRVILTAAGPAADGAFGPLAPRRLDAVDTPAGPTSDPPSENLTTAADSQVRTSFFSWFRKRVRPATALASQSLAVESDSSTPLAETVATPDEPSPGAAALTGALNSLGMAHHRPFSRS